MRWAVAAAGFKKRITVHTLRHCYATHLLESGISIRHISAYLGHASLNQTLVYAHLSAVGEERTAEVLKKLHQEVIAPSAGSETITGQA
jgi:site-specific recombinase XerD